MTSMGAFVAVTDKAWFDYLSSKASGGRVDEVNFWSPSASRRMKDFKPGDPIFFRLKSPHNVVAGYGFFGWQGLLPMDEAWRTFGWRNGDPDEDRFMGRIAGYRGKAPSPAAVRSQGVWCTVLRAAMFWERERWRPWTDGWPPNVVRGREERDPARADLLRRFIEEDHARDSLEMELGPTYKVVTEDQRLRKAAEIMVRQGQGTFRARLLDAYGQACAITGEHTVPVLDAAHIQPYLGPDSNHLQNGLLLTKEFHTLFDAGLVTVTPDYSVRVSPALRDRWNNGRRYYAYDGKPLASLPKEPQMRPSRDALAWHMSQRYIAG